MCAAVSTPAQTVNILMLLTVYFIQVCAKNQIGTMKFIKTTIVPRLASHFYTRKTHLKLDGLGLEASC